MLFTGYLLSRELNTSCLPFRTFHLYASSRQLALLQTPECSEYHPSKQSPVVSTLSYQTPVIWNQLPVSVRHSTSIISFKSSLKIFLFLKAISSVPLSWHMTLCVYVCVCACVCLRCMHWILKICAFKERVSIYSLCRLGTLSIHYYYYTLWSVTTTNYYRFRSELWFLYLFCKSCIPAEKCHTTVSVFDQQTCERQDLDAEASSPVLTSSTHNYSAKQTNAKCTG